MENQSKYCICVYCDVKVIHQKANPCKSNKCPECGKSMMREGSYHHQLYLSKK